MIMAKYDPLYKYLLRCDSRIVTLTFDEIEKILGGNLPNSAYQYAWWWANEDVDITRHTHCISWQNAGYKQVSLDLRNKRVTFEKAI